MLVDEIGDVTITNDGATILALLDIEHPAAKVLVELAQLQDQEVLIKPLIKPTDTQSSKYFFVNIIIGWRWYD